MANMSSLLTCDYFSFKQKLRIILFFQCKFNQIFFGEGGGGIVGTGQIFDMTKKII